MGVRLKIGWSEWVSQKVAFEPRTEGGKELHWASTRENVAELKLIFIQEGL